MTIKNTTVAGNITWDSSNNTWLTTDGSGITWAANTTVNHCIPPNNINWGIAGGGIWPSTPTSTYNAASMYSFRLLHKNEEMVFAEKLADTPIRSIKEVTSVEYSLKDGEETLKLELLSNAESHSCIYKVLYGNEFYLVVEEKSALGTMSTSRIVEILGLTHITNSANASLAMVGRLSLSLKIKTIAIEINENGKVERINL